ncbi:MAG: hypothetical protein IJ829_06090, partial [Kiritimatiellae bacterium]|nr:hypothetical protein [Kiritimatiellia bacterium]
APVAARFGRGGTGGLLELSREAKDDIDSRFAERIRAIRAAPDREIPAGAEHRYLSAATGDDSADGKTRATAWRTTGRLNKEKLSPGTFVLFERGGVYRGGVSACDGVTYAAYGKGEKPTVCSSPEDGADPAKWEPTDAEGVWRYMIGGRDVGTLVFDGGAALAVKIVPVYHADGTFTQQYGGRPFDNGYKDLAGDLHFWHDYSAKTKFQPHAKGSGYLYLRSKENPGRRFRSIEFCVRRHGFEVGRHTDVTIDNICVKYVGSHGVGAGTTRNLKVVNCEFAWIGGSIQAEGLFGRNAPVRFGNAVEVYGGCDDYVVDGCYVHDVYDAGVTHQYNWKGGAPVDMKNVRYSRNVIERCNYSVEYFLKPVTNVVGDTSHMENIVIEGNLMRDAARGFCEHRPDRRQGAHIKSWRYWGGEHHTNRARGYVIRDNVFDRSGDMLVEISSSLLNPDGSDSMPTLSDNVFVGEKGQRFGVLNQGKVVELAYDDDLPARLGPDVAGNNVFLSTR